MRKATSWRAAFVMAGTTLIMAACGSAPQMLQRGIGPAIACHPQPVAGMRGGIVGRQRQRLLQEFASSSIAVGCGGRSHGPRSDTLACLPSQRVPVSPPETFRISRDAASR
jgi:hypothetical protein